MSLSDIKITKTIYLGVSILVLLFSIVYEMFSHGVFSIYMISAFLIPLILGYIVFKIIDKFKIRKLNVVAVNLYHTIVSTLTIYFITHGFLDIYGTTNSLINYYIYAIILLIVLTIIFQIKEVLHE